MFSRSFLQIKGVNHMELLKGIQPFWFWNGDLAPEEIRRQIREMQDKGIRGFLIHPRQGMEVPYLSAEFFRRVQVAVEEAAAYGLEVWLYDEYPYPSGVAAGLVTVDHPEYLCKKLSPVTQDVDGGSTIRIEAPWGKVLSARAYPVTDAGCDYHTYIDLAEYVGPDYGREVFQLSGLTAYNRKRYFTGEQRNHLLWDAPKGRYRIHIYVEEVMKHFKYFETFVDPLNPAAVRQFIECTHERYKKYVGDEFGKTIKGFFSDEVTAFPPGRPWSSLLPDRWPADRDIYSDLPALTEDIGPETARIRYIYHNLVTEMFIDSYDKQIYEWCSANGLLYIGEKPILRSKELAYVSVPGIDTGHLKVGAKADPLPAGYRSNGKVASSGAHFYHKPAALCEAFHSIGWGMTLQDMKWIFDWLAVTGIDWFVQHAFYYSAEALHKHDAPPSSFYQMPWWHEQKTLSQYADQLSHLWDGMKRRVHVLLMDPAPAGWVLDREGQKKAGASLQAVQHSLMRSGCDYYFIDPELFAEAEVRDGLLYVNGEPYACVVLPDMCLIEDNAFRTLRKFVEAGGTVVVAGGLPCVNIGEEDSAGWFAELFAGKNVPAEDTGEAVSAVLQKKLADYAASVLPEGTYCAEGTDPESGRSRRFLVNTTDRPQKLVIGYADGTQRTFELGPLESVIDDGADVPAGNVLQIPNGRWTLARTGQNVLYLGRFRLTLSDGQTGITGGYPIIDQMEELGLKMPVQTHPYFGCPKELAFSGVEAVYEADFDWLASDTRADLVMEPGTMAGEWKMLLNGAEIDKDGFASERLEGRPVLRIPLTGIRQGRNRLTVCVSCGKDSDGLRNPLYILGNFGVRIGEAAEQAAGQIDGEMDGQAPGQLAGQAAGKHATEPVQGGNLLQVVAPRQDGIPGKDVENGLPYYAGESCFTQTFAWDGDGSPDTLDLSCLELPDVVRVTLNGTDLGVSAWEPRRLQIPQGVLRKGENTLLLQVYNTMQGFYEGQTFDRAAHRYVDLQDPEAIQQEKHFLA